MDDIILNKAAIIERCLKRIHEDYHGYEEEFKTSFLRQDAIILNLQRACEASIDLAAHIIRGKKLGLPQTSRDMFTLLQEAGIIDAQLSDRLQKMTGFRNIAMHNYQKLDLAIVQHLIEHRLGDIQAFSSAILALDR